MCAAAANKWFGVPVITYDAMLEDPLTARRTLEAWLVGAGGKSPTLGLRFQPAQAVSEGEAPSRIENELPDAAAVGGGKALLSVEEARELYYSYAGDYAYASQLDPSGGCGSSGPSRGLLSSTDTTR